MAGHSKWANIQHRKGRQDSARSRLFSKLSREVTIAAKLGDPDPDNNPRLRLAIKEAKLKSLPKSVIERAISKASGAEADALEEIRYEGYGPGGIAVIVEAMTNNRNRTASKIRSIFGKAGGALAETGAVSYLFERKGEIVFPAVVGDVDTVMDAAIEAGADDVESNGDYHIIYTVDTELAAVSLAMESAVGEAETTKIIWKPVTTAELDLDGAQKAIKLIDALEEEEDVQEVTSNIEIPDEIMAEL